MLRNLLQPTYAPDEAPASGQGAVTETVKAPVSEATFNVDEDLYIGADTPETNFADAEVKVPVEGETAPTPEGTTPQEKPEAADAAPEGEKPAETPVEPAQVPITQEQIKEFRRQVDDGLTEFYKLSEEDAAALRDSPETVLPKLAARVHYTAVEGAVTAVLQALPQFLNNMQAQNRVVHTNEEKFYTRWPALRAHAADVLQVGTVWRNMNPQAPLDDWIEKVGAIVASMKGATTEPVRQPSRAGASGGAPTTRQTVPVPSDFWSELAKVDDD